MEGNKAGFAEKLPDQTAAIEKILNGLGQIQSPELASKFKVFIDSAKR